MNISEEDVTIVLEHELDDLEEYESMTSIYVDIFVRDKAAGKIRGTRVDRKKIPERCFYSVMDDQSADLQYVAVSLFEPRFGRTKLQSLAQEGDHMDSDFLYINSLQINEEYTANGSSDVGAFALRKLLHHPYIHGNPAQHALGSYISSCVYILGSKNAEARNHAIQFLRNGFFQDRAVVGEGGDRFLVAAHGHWSKSLKSHAEAAAIPFLESPSEPAPLTGMDAEIRRVVDRPNQFSSDGNSTLYQAELARLMSQGGSLARARALHVACANKNIPMAEFILRADPSALESQDETMTTPLMVAAAAAAGSANNMGIPRDQPIIDLLLEAGARNDVVDSKGMTAYGVLMKRHQDLSEMMQVMMGDPATGASSDTPGLDELKSKLTPPGGPTAADLTGGPTEGFMDYSEQDAEYDQADY